MQINFTNKELQAIQIIVPDMTPEETCNKVLRDWFDSNLQRFPQKIKTSDEIVDDVIAVNTQELKIKNVVK